MARVILSGLFCAFFLTGCFSGDFQPTYKEGDISDNIKKICLDEYKLDVSCIRAGGTLWVYAPQPRILHAEFGKNPDKIFDDGIIDRARNILTSISRVMLSCDKSPDFFVLVLSDVKLGLDYSFTVNSLDIKKSASGVIPWNEANKRYVVNFVRAPEAVGDMTGAHLKPYDIKMPEFITLQIAQRVKMFFQNEAVKGYLVLKEANVGFQDNDFIVEYSVSVVSEPPEEINVEAGILDIIVYCFKTYEFSDFSRVRIKDIQSGRGGAYEKRDILSRTIA